MADSNHPNLTTTPTQPINNNQPDVMTDMLCQLTQSNQSLLERIEKNEQQEVNSHQTTVVGGLSTKSQPLYSHGASLVQKNLPHHPISHHLFNSSARTASNTLPTSNNCTCSASQQSITASNIHGTTAVLQHEGVVLSLENLRRVPNVSQAVTNAFAAYEYQAKSTLLGKQRHSGRYNTTDIAQNPPEMHWPNEGYNSSAGRKGYQRVTGQLSNVYNMKDPLTAKHALFQVILAVKDATSLHWGAVRSVWVTSMHDLE